MARIKEVCDVWFDSGSMPFAQAHFPFAFRQGPSLEFSKRTVLGGLDYPADYICEAIDQTRGWFFTLLAVAVLLGKERPYKNVLSLGLVLDNQGQKMSKSRGNAVEPMELMKKYGADAVRWYFYTINQPWDEKLFKEEDVNATLKRFIFIFWNCFTYWQTYNENSKFKIQNSKLLINRWLLARFNQIAAEATKLLDKYEIVSAARLIESFVIDDISHWYIRRIRETMKNQKSKEAKETGIVLGYTLVNTAKLLAPFMPFISETVYRQADGKKKSVHLENWPAINQKSKIKNQKLLKEMEMIREIVSRALELRAKAGIKVRQPIASLKIKNQKSKIKNNEELLNLIRGEVNVKEIIFDQNIKDEIELDTTITEELKEEGILRELIRQMQDIRKKEGLKPGQMVDFYIATDLNGKNFLVKYAKEIKKSVNAKSLIVRLALEDGYEIKTNEFNFKVKPAI
jgi:isoleucyl-tRNA synthetase